MRIAFIGQSASFSYAHIKKMTELYEIALIIEAAPRNYRGEKLPITPYSLKRFATSHHIDYFFAQNISKEAEALLKEKGCDLLCIASCSQLIKKNIIDIPPCGVINAHPSFLPQYRGPNPGYWVFYHQEKVGACTIHYIDEGEDTGDIILQQTFEIPFGQTKAAYTRTILKISPNLMCEAIHQLQMGTAKRHPQVISSHQLVRARNLKPEDYIYHWDTWEVKAAYHLMRGTDCLDTGRQQSCFRIIPTAFLEGRILNRKNAIICKNGVVFYHKRLSFKKSVRAILQKIGL